MHTLILMLIIAALTFDYLAETGLAPGLLAYTQELLSLIAAIYVVAGGVRDRFRFVRADYWVLFGALAFVVVAGAFVNSMDSGPLFAGMRTYLRALPLFFLPAVFLIDDRKLRQQLLLVLVLALVQVPLAVYQRMTVWAKGHISGDWVIGTIMNSGVLSIFLICVACVLTGMYLRKRLRFLPYAVLVLVILIPTTVNETKATIFLAPLGLLVTFLAGSDPGKRARNTTVAVLVIAAFTAIFIPVYDYYVKPRWGYGIIDFFMMEGRLEGYLKKDATVGSEEAGRIDALVVPLRELSRDPGQLAFGLGIGNVSDSALGEQFVGKHFRRLEPFRISQASILLMETGVLGLAFLLLFCWMVFRDAWVVAHRDTGLHGALAVGWMGVMAVIVVATFYKQMATYGVAFLFWLFCGIVAARRMRLALTAPEPVRVSRTRTASARFKTVP